MKVKRQNKALRFSKIAERVKWSGDPKDLPFEEWTRTELAQVANKDAEKWLKENPAWDPLNEEFADDLDDPALRELFVEK